MAASPEPGSAVVSGRAQSAVTNLAEKSRQ